MKKLMILGGGPNQMPLIKAAKKNGYCVALCDFSDKAAGVALADEFYLVSIMDLDGVIEAAKTAAVDGIVTNSEPAMQIATDAANRLGLPANDSDVIALLSSKVRFRELQKKENFVAPASGEAESYEEALALAKRMTLPIIVKPAASSGSRGVTKVENFDELEKAVEYALHYTRNGQVVVEEFFVNHNIDLLGGDVFVSDGEVVFWGLLSDVRDKKYFPLLPGGKRYPIAVSDEQVEIVKAETSRIVHASGFKFGALNLEIMLGKNGEVFFVEINPRNGGNLIPEELQYATGFDIFDATVRAALGESIPMFDDRGSMPNANYLVHSRVNGTLKQVRFSEDLKPYVIDYVPDINPGEEVEPFINADKRVGTLFMRFDTVERRDEMLEVIEDHIFVEVE